jgi:hypothetical protein
MTESVDSQHGRLDRASGHQIEAPASAIRSHPCTCALPVLILQTLVLGPVQTSSYRRAQAGSIVPVWPDYCTLHPQHAEDVHVSALKGIVIR